MEIWIILCSWINVPWCFLYLSSSCTLSRGGGSRLGILPQHTVRIHQQGLRTQAPHPPQHPNTALHCNLKMKKHNIILLGQYFTIVIYREYFWYIYPIFHGNWTEEEYSVNISLYISELYLFLITTRQRCGKANGFNRVCLSDPPPKWTVPKYRPVPAVGYIEARNQFRGHGHQAPETTHQWYLLQVHI